MDAKGKIPGSIKNSLIIVFELTVINFIAFHYYSRIERIASFFFIIYAKSNGQLNDVISLN